MRVLHVIAGFGTGGVEKLVVDLAMAQKELGLSVEIAALAHRESAVTRGIEVTQRRQLSANGVPTMVLGTGQRNPVGAALALRPHLVDVDLLHAHIVVGALASELAQFRSAPPSVLTLHSTEFGFPRWGLRVARAWVDRFVGCSPTVVDALKDYLPSGTQAVENGIDLRPFRAVRSKTQTQEPQTEFTLLTVGRLRQAKNHRRLIEAVLMARSQLLGTKLTLQIAGDGPLMEDLRQLIASAGAQGSIRLLGARTDIAQLFSDADAFVLSSDREGLPISLLEAMASGVPCLITPFEGAEQLSDGGRTVMVAESFAAEDLAASIVKLVSDRSMRMRLVSAADDRLEQFDIDRCARDYLGVYEDVLKESGRG